MSIRPLPDFETHDAGVRRRALSAFRGRRRFRRAGQGACALAAAGALFLAAAWPGAKPQPHSVVPDPPAPVLSREVHLLTDQELIGLFPPGSCFMAEVDGKKVLIFTDPEMEKRFLN